MLHYVNVNKSIRYLLTEKNWIDTGDRAKTRLASFSDASFSNIRNNGSQGVFIVFGEQQWQICTIVQAIQKKKIMKRTVAMKTMALVEEIESMIGEIVGNYVREVVCLILAISDKSLFDAAHSTLSSWSIFSF